MLLPFDALLIDMDGTLVDSEAAVNRAWANLARRLGVTLDAVLANAHGRRSLEVVRQFITDNEARARREADRVDAEEAADLTDIRPMPGAAALLAAVPEGRWTLVTSAGRAAAENRLRVAGLRFPSHAVCAEDVTEGKPAPDGYREAARRLGVDPARCIVLEDALAGIRAGRAAGATVLDVGGHPRPDEPRVFRVRDLSRVSVVHGPGGPALQLSEALVDER